MERNVLNIFNPHDERPELNQFWDLVQQYRKNADDLRGRLLRGPRRAALVRLQTETQALLQEATYLITNAPVQLHDDLGDDVFKSMHQDVTDAVALDGPSPLETSDLDLVRERLSICVDLARYVFDLLNESIERVAPGVHIGVHGATSSVPPGRENGPA